MKVLDDLLDFVRPFDAPVRRIFVGVHWTVVESRGCGLASTQIEPPPHYKSRVRDVGELDRKGAHELAGLVRSQNWLEASIGMAALNSLIEIDEGPCENRNAFEVLSATGADKEVAIIGHFPFVERLHPLVGKLWVIELNPHDGDVHAEQAAEILPRCDVVGLTATTLINHTFDDITAHCKEGAFKIMIGPTTPMVPVLFDYGIDMLAGSKIYDTENVIRHIQQGATFRQLKGVKVLTWQKRS